MSDEAIARLRPWTSSVNFYAQCNDHNMSLWNQNFLRDRFHNRLDAHAVRNGHSDIARIRSIAVIEAIAAAGRELAAGGLTPATQQRVHRAYQAYAEAAAIYNPDRVGWLDAHRDHALTPPEARTNAWYAADAARRGSYH